MLLGLATVESRLHHSQLMVDRLLGEVEVIVEEEGEEEVEEEEEEEEEGEGGKKEEERQVG